MKKALIIIPYFGKLPPWFQLYLNSAKSGLVDFLLYTDDHTPFTFPDNFSVKYYTFKDFKEYFISNAGTELYLNLDHPYKLCDYRPLYGKVFQDDLKGYEYWGFADIDLIFGDIDLFIKPYMNSEFDKLFQYGHFSLLRNDEHINNLFESNILNYNFKFVKNTSLPCHFDEVSFNEIIKAEKKIYIQDQPFHNININHMNFAVGGGRPVIPQLIVHDDGKLYIAEDTALGIVRSEIFYIHFMRRKNLPVRFSEGDRYVICRDGFISFENDADLKHLFEKYGLPVNADTEFSYRKSLQQSIAANKKNTFKREFNVFKLKAVYNILFHYYLHKIWRY